HIQTHTHTHTLVHQVSRKDINYSHHMVTTESESESRKRERERERERESRAKERMRQSYEGRVKKETSQCWLPLKCHSDVHGIPWEAKWGTSGHRDTHTHTA